MLVRPSCMAMLGSSSLCSSHHRHLQHHACAGQHSRSSRQRAVDETAATASGAPAAAELQGATHLISCIRSAMAEYRMANSRSKSLGRVCSVTVRAQSRSCASAGLASPSPLSILSEPAGVAELLYPGTLRAERRAGGGGGGGGGGGLVPCWVGAHPLSVSLFSSRTTDQRRRLFRQLLLYHLLHRSHQLQAHDNPPELELVGNSRNTAHWNRTEHSRLSSRGTRRCRAIGQDCIIQDSRVHSTFTLDHI
jgi:hypothetical protein